MTFTFLGFAIASLAYPQAPALPHFEVASVKPNRSGETLYYKSYPNRFTARNMTARTLMNLAFPLGSAGISGGDPWLSSDGFDIEATTEHPVTWGQMQLMFQSLLAERFHLIFHREMKDVPVYALVTARNGLKIQLSSDQTPWTGDHPDEPGTTGANMDIRPGSLTGESIPLAMLINFISSQVGRTVVNQTGTSARYAINLHWTPDLAVQPDSPDASIFTALQEQLGLKLESTRGPVEMIIIERIDRPSAN
jgi:bla regulator protein BlaR1